MSVSGLCDICTNADIEDSCERCGKLVCDQHFDDQTGFCVKCSAEIATGDREHIPQGDDLPDGVDTYRF